MTAPIRILAFGASIIEGFYSNEFGGMMRPHPMTKQLGVRLRERFPQLQFEIINAGNEGECAVQMPHRLERLLSRDDKFDFAIFHAGTNDFARATPAGHGFLGSFERLDDDAVSKHAEEVSSAVFAALVQMASMCADRRVHTVLNSLLHSGYEYKDAFDFRHFTFARRQLCEKLRAFATDNASSCTFFDLGEVVPFGDDYYAEDIHLNPTGYDRFGDFMFSVLAPLIEQRLIQNTE